MRNLLKTAGDHGLAVRRFLTGILGGNAAGAGVFLLALVTALAVWTITGSEYAGRLSALGVVLLTLPLVFLRLYRKEKRRRNVLKLFR